MSTKTSTKWNKDMLFDADVAGHHVMMDAGHEVGGADQGARPKPLLLAALSGCSGMDVVSILKKMRVPEYQLKIDIEADSTTEHPMYYHTIRMNFLFEGENLPMDKLLRAVELSTQKYCGVMAMLKKAANITVKTYLNGDEIDQ